MIARCAFVTLLVNTMMAAAAGAQTPCIDAEPIRITTGGPTAVGGPAISGDLIVWRDARDPAGHNIWLHDLQTGTPTQISMGRRATRPEISGRRIVWWERGGSAWEPGIYVHDLDTGQAQLIPSGPLSTSVGPHIDGDWIVWHRWNGSDYDLEMFNLATSEEKKIEGATNDLHGRISGNTVLWQRIGAGVMLHDLRDDPSEVTPLAPNGRLPDISGDNAAWRLFPGGVEYRNLATGNSLVHFPWEGVRQRVRISGSRIVWHDDSSDIHAYDLTEEHAVRATCDSVRQFQPDVSGNRIVWVEEDPGPFGDIYLLEFATAPTLDDVIDRIDGYAEDGLIKAGVAEAMRALADQAAASLERGNTLAATRALEATIRFILGQSQNQIDPEIASLLVDELNAVIAGL
jgi:beta propeller repeat protein